MKTLFSHKLLFLLYCIVFGVLVSGWQTGIARANTYVVNTTADENDLVGIVDGNGQTSLREAMILANNNPGPDTITFTIPAGGLKVITVTSALPAIADAVTIDGTTQPGAPPNPHPPLIAITDANPGTRSGLVLTTGGSGSTIQGLCLYGFVDAIDLDQSNNNTFKANFLGLKQDGSATPGNTNLGIYVASSSGNIIGAPNAGNVISGNATAGITISASASDANNNVVQSNLIGTNPTGTASVGSAQQGVFIGSFGASVTATNNTVGGMAAGTPNIIAGNGGSGVVLYGSTTISNQVFGNFIGTDAAGTTSLPNATGNSPLTGGGIAITNGANHNLIGSTSPGGRNLISGNKRYGVYISDPGTNQNTVQSNFIGTDTNGTAALGNEIDGVIIQNGAASNTVGGTVPNAGNVLSANQSGVYINGIGTDSNMVQGNLIGTDKNGTADLGNLGRGVLIENGANNLIGGPTAGSRNIISGNDTLGGSGAVEINRPNATNNVVQGNFIGTDITGGVALGNNDQGVLIVAGAHQNTIGGTTAAERNIISGNGYDGVLISGNSTNQNIVEGNYIGTNASGLSALPNVQNGIAIGDGPQNNLIGGPTAASRNVLSGNGHSGVVIYNTTNNILENNYIGTDVNGTAALPNQDIGLYILNAGSNTIGTANAGNLISGNNYVPGHATGIRVEGASATGNTIAANYIGTDKTGATALGNGGDGVDILSGASGNTIGGTTSGLRNIISGNFIGVYINGANSNFVEGNHIGTDVNGTVGLGNSSYGVLLELGAQGNNIGGAAPGIRNVIAGNAGGGVVITGNGTNDNLVAGNYIGLDSSGSTTLGNGGNGVTLDAGAQSNTIGSVTPGGRNIISGNAANGVLISHGATLNSVVSSYIGTDAAGSTAKGNGAYGVAIQSGAPSNTVGGNAAGNVISGNAAGGVLLDSDSTKSNAVQGDLIGTSADGTVAVGNGAYGVLVSGAASNNLIGGSGAGQRNVISGNVNAGVAIQGGSTAGNVVQGNYIGTDQNGTGPLGNAVGVVISDAINNIIGDDGTGQGNSDNTIAFNSGDGVSVTGGPSSGMGNAIRRNSIFGNGGLGINLIPGGEGNDTVTPNDAGDTDTGPNNLQNFPILSSAVVTGSGSFTGSNTATVTGTLNSTPQQTFTIDLYGTNTPDPSGNGEGETYFGSTQVTTDVNGNANVSFSRSIFGPSNIYITATATDNSGNTSEFSPCIRLVPAISINDVSVTEGDSGIKNADFTVTLAQPSSDAISVNYATANGTATAGSDYTAVSGTLNFAPGVTSQTVSVPIVGDTLNELDETFTVNLSNPTNAALGKAQGLGTIVNDDPLPTVSITDLAVIEGNQGFTSAVFAVNLSTASGQTVSVNHATADGTAVASVQGTPSDYQASSGVVNFPPGVTSRNVTVAVIGDTTNEADETFFVNLSSPVNATIAKAQGTGAIVNDDPVPGVSINDVSVKEGDSGTVDAVFTVTLDAASEQNVSVDYATANGTAVQPSDYTAATGTLTFAPGETTKQVTIKVNGDTLNEANETFLVNLTNLVNTSPTKAQGIGTITDDDPLPSLSINNVSLQEGNSGTTNAIFTVTLSPVSGQTVSVNYASADGTATEPSDYVSTSGTLTFPAGTATKTMSVPVKGDILNEGDETFTLNLSSAKNAIITKTQGVGTIINDDLLPSLTIGDVSVKEGDSGTTNADFTVSLTTASSKSVTVDYATADGTAKAASDYVSTAGTLSFAPGTTTKTITVPVKGDTLNEDDQTFFVNLSNPTNANIFKTKGIGIIVNDDPVPSLSINDVSLNEGDSGTTNAAFTVTLSTASGKTVSVSYATANGTASEPTDYTATAGTLTFAPGEIIKTINVAVKGNTLLEPDKTFSVNLSNAINATFTKNKGTGTIVNDDQAVTPTPTPTPPGSPIVINTGDSGAGSLRDAINYANASPGTTIKFNIPKTDAGFSNGVFSIKLLRPLPPVTADGTIIDGGTQKAFSGDSNPAGPEVALVGAQAGINATGLEIDSANCVVKGLDIYGFSGSGLLINGAQATRDTVQGCYIGTTPTGNQAVANGLAGIGIVNGAQQNTIGGATAEARNLISGNGGSGVVIDGSNNNSVLGNYIGTDASGTQMLANLLHGVEIVHGSAANIIGSNATSGSSIAGSNVIAFNRNDGVRLSESGNGNTIRGNSIYGNASLGINLVGRVDRSDGVTLNDPGDKDTGPNGLQNFPVITDISPADAGGTELDGTLNSTPNSTFTLDFYRNVAPGGSGYGQGQEYIGSTNVQTNGAGNATFSFTFNGTGQFFAATATNTATGDTSEFSAVPLNITNFSPTSGPVGTLVTINGAGFTESTVVLFTNANDADGFVSSDDGGLVSSTQILARVPKGATTGPIAVANEDGSETSFSSTDFQVVTGPGQPPPNDNFANAQVIQGDSGTVTGTNVLATKESGEPTHADVGGSSSVWYKWTASTTGNASFNTTGSDFDTVLAVYQGNAVNALTPVANNDNAGIGNQSALRFNSTAGQTYYIAVDGYDYGGITAQGKVVLNWAVTVGRPANDNFANAQVIVGNSGHVTGTNVQATKEPGEPNHANNPGGRSVWYAWTAPARGNATFTTAQSDFDTLLAVYTGKNTSGNTVRTLNLVASNDDEDVVLTSSVTFQTVAGRTYYIVVDGYDYEDGLKGDQGRVVLDWALEVSNGATVRWINPAGGQWGNANNWSPARVPGPTDIATINLPGTYSITENINTTVGGMALGATSGTQTLVLNGHTLTLNGISSVAAHGVLNLSQGTLNEHGSLTIAGVFNWTGGHLGGSGSTNIASAGVWNINDPASGVATRKFLDQKAANNFGTVNWRGKGSIIGGNGTKFRNSNLFYAMSDATFGWDGIGDNPSFINMPGGSNMPYGKLIKTAGQGTEDVVTTPATVFDKVVLFNSGANNANLSGFVRVQQGTLRLQGGGQSYGRFDVPSGSQLQFTSDYFFAKDYSIITGTGHICILGNTVSMNTDVNAETFSVCDGTLTGDSTLTATRFFNWEGGTMSGHGQTNIGHGATFSIHGTTNHTIIGRTLNNAGIADWIGKSHILANGGATINNTGTFNTQNGTDGSTLDHNAGNDPTFNNSGVLNPGGSQQTATGHSVGTRSVSATLAGVFSIYGNYKQSAGGILNMDIGGKVPGSSYDQVNIKGTAQLGGTLNVKLQPGYTPQPGDTFEVVHYDSRQGVFNVNFQNLPPNMQMQTIYTDTGANKGLSVKVVSVIAGTYTISGRVVDSGGAGVAGVKITRDGADTANSPASTVTDAGGNYTLSNVSPATYTLTATLNGATFDQNSRSVKVSGSNVTANFTALFSISGRVVNNAGNGIANVTVERRSSTSGPGTQTAQTDANGYYTLSGVPQGHNIVIPIRANYGFTPPVVDVVITTNSGSARDVNFTGFQGPYISGRVSEGSSTGAGLAGVTVKRTDGSGHLDSVVTDAKGYYNFEAVAPGTYVVGPIDPHFLFNFATVTVSSSVNVANLNFAGVRLNSNAGSTRSVRSKVALSSAVARAASQNIVLQFTGQLDQNEAVEPAHYQVKINGRVVGVESVSYRSNTRTVVLGLPDGTLHSGDKVVVALTELPDAKGAVLGGQVGPLSVK